MIRRALTGVSGFSKTNAAWPVVATAIAFAVPIASFWNVLVARSSTFYAAQDNSQAFFPWFQKLSIAIHHGYLPLWDAGVQAGYSFAGETATAIFYPVNIAVVTLFGSQSGIALWYLELLLVVHYAISFAGMYLFARRLHFEPAAAIVGGLVFSFTGPHAFRATAQVPIFISYSLIPLAAYFAVGYAQDGRKRSALLAGAVMGCEVLAGHIAAPLFSMLICLALLVGLSARSRPALIGSGVALMVLALLVIAAPQLGFGYQAALSSYRISGTVELLPATATIPFEAIDQYSLPVGGLLSLFAPDRFSAGNDPGNSLFMGALPLLIVLLAGADRTARASVLRATNPLAPLYFLGVVVLLVALGGATPLGRLWYSLPLVGTLVREPGRYGLVFEFAFCTLVAQLLSVTMKASGRLPRLTAATLGAAGLALLEACLLWFSPGGAASAVVACLVVVVFLVKRSQLFAASLVALSAFEATAIAREIPYSVESPEYAATLWRNSPIYTLPEKCYPTCRLTVDDPTNRLPLNLGDAYALQITSGYTALVDKKYHDFRALDWSDMSFQNDLLNVRYILATSPLTGLRLVDADRSRDLYLYERLTAFPRVYSLAAATSRNRSLNDARFSVVHYDDLSQIYDVEVPKAETVVFSEQFYPGWSVKVDQTRVPMLVAGVGVGPAILRAVSLPPGEHVVSFSYPTIF